MIDYKNEYLKLIKLLKHKNTELIVENLNFRKNVLYNKTVIQECRADLIVKKLVQRDPEIFLKSPSNVASIIEQIESGAE